MDWTAGYFNLTAEEQGDWDTKTIMVKLHWYDETPILSLSGHITPLIISLIGLILSEQPKA